MLLNLKDKSKRFIVWIKFSQRFFILFLFVFFFGCASFGTYNPATERNEVIFISTPAEVSMGREIHSKILSELEISTDTQKTQRLNRIGTNVASASDRQDYEYKFYLIENEQLNAFTTPGGNIYFYSGLFNKLKRDDEIAAVLAHEIGHCAARHTVKKYQASLGYNIIGSIASVFLGPQIRDIASMTSDAVMNLVFSAYSRHDEYEADRLAVKYLAVSGYDLNGMLSVLNTLKSESNADRGLLILRSHPYLEDRIKEVKQQIEAIEFGS